MFDKSTSLEEHSTWSFKTARNKSFAIVIGIFFHWSDTISVFSFKADLYPF